VTCFDQLSGDMIRARGDMRCPLQVLTVNVWQTEEWIDKGIQMCHFHHTVKERWIKTVL